MEENLKNQNTQQKLELTEKEIYEHDQLYQDKLFDESPWNKEYNLIFTYLLKRLF